MGTVRETKRVGETRNHPPGRAIGPAGRVTLRQLAIAPSTFYGWYQRFLGGGIEALHDKKPKRRPKWNQIPEPARAEVVQLALEKTELCIS